MSRFTKRFWLRDVSLSTYKFWLRDVSFITIKLPLSDESAAMSRFWCPVILSVTSRLALTFVLPPTTVFPMLISCATEGKILNVSLLVRICPLSLTCKSPEMTMFPDASMMWLFCRFIKSGAYKLSIVLVFSLVTALKTKAFALTMLIVFNGYVDTVMEFHVWNPSTEYRRVPSFVVAMALLSSKTLTLVSMVAVMVKGVHVIKSCV